MCANFYQKTKQKCQNYLKPKTIEERFCITMSFHDFAFLFLRFRGFLTILHKKEERGFLTGTLVPKLFHSLGKILILVLNLAFNLNKKYLFSQQKTL